MHELKCGEIWGGIHGNDVDLCTSGIEASLFSSACKSGKGGDIYYFSVCGGNRLTRIAIADVTGHGEEVSHTSQKIYDTLKRKINNLKSDRILAELNDFAVDYGFKAMTTAAIATFSRKNDQLYFSYAGHYPILIRSALNHQWSSLTLPVSERTANVPLGISKDLPYDRSSQKMSAGDLIFLYTDGLVEARNEHGELFGEAKLLAALNSAPDNIKQIKDTVLRALKEHAGEDLDHDDVTLMAIRIREKRPSLLGKLQTYISN